MDGLTYYVSPAGTYYRPTSHGYVVMPRPSQHYVAPRHPQHPPFAPPFPPRAVQQVTTVVSSETTFGTQTVWIVNPNGSRSSVTLRATEGGMWVGPKGEYYQSLPTEQQLLPVYGIQQQSTPVAAQPTPERTATTVWIVNPNGSRTPVKLEPAEGGLWTGPKGETYETLPTEEQLRAVYGLSQ